MAKSIETSSAETLVLFPGSLGDFVCVLPALEVLKEARLSQNIALAVRGPALELASHLPGISRVLSLDRRAFASLFTAPTVINEEVVRLFSSVVQVISWFGHNSPEVQLTLEQLVPKYMRSFAFFRGQEQLHACRYYLRCVGSGEIRCPSLVVADESKKWLERYWLLKGWSAASRVLILHPGSGGKKKRWAVEGFVHIARWWATQHRQVVILLGPAEEQEEELWSTVGTVESTLSLWQVAALLSRSDLYVGNDSGVSHLAGAVGARGVVLFGPTNPEQWRPVGGALTVIAKNADQAMAPDAVGISLRDVSSAAVIAELARVSGIR